MDVDVEDKMIKRICVTITKDETDGNITIVLKNIWDNEDEDRSRTAGQKQLDKDRIQTDAEEYNEKEE